MAPPARKEPEAMDLTPKQIVDLVKREGGLLNVSNPEAIEARRGLLRARRERALQDVTLRGEEAESKPEHELGTIERALTDEEERRNQRARDRRYEAEQAAAWREVGIQQRVRTPGLPRHLRWLALAFLATIDFYVFALAIAKDQDVAASPAQPLFLFGGVLGLVVFGAGLVLSHLGKEVVYAWQQRKLLDEINTGDRQVSEAVRVRLVVSKPQWVTLSFVTLIFGLLSGYAFAIRYWEMSAGDNPNVVIFLSLIPLLAVGVELYLYDPSQVDPPRPSLRTRRLLSAREHWEGVRGEVRARAAHERGSVEGVFREAEALLEVEISRMLADAAAATQASNGDGGGPAADDGGGSDWPGSDWPGSDRPGPLAGDRSAPE